MKYLYSGKMFYPLSLKNDYQKSERWPTGGIEVDEETFLEYSCLAPEGYMLGEDSSGTPEWVPLPVQAHDELVAIAEDKKQRYITTAQDTIRLWETELQLGIICDDDKNSLIAWIGYIKALQTVDTSTAPDIEWPVKPE